MGYYSYLSEQITFDPPMTHAEVRAWQNAAHPNAAYPAVTFDIEEIKSETDEGLVTSLTANTITPDSGHGKWYDFESELRHLLRFIPDRTFSGYIERSGEEQGDLERYSVLPGTRMGETPATLPTVVSKKAKIVWED